MLVTEFRSWVTSYECCLLTPIKKDNGCWRSKWLKPSPKSWSCHQYFSSPTSVINISRKMLKLWCLSRYGQWIWANFNWKVFLKNFRKSGIFRFHIEFKDKSDNRLKNFSSRCFFLCCPLPASLSMICVRRAQHDDHGAPPSSFAIRFKPRARTTTRSPPRYRSTKHLYFLLKTLTLQTVSRDSFDRDY